MLLEMDKLFGKSIDGRAPAFSLYGSYDDVPNVIFPVSFQEFLREIALESYIALG